MIRAGATDERNYVKKPVSWALRNAGKRNARLDEAALPAAREIGEIDSRAARWIASGAIRDLARVLTRRVRTRDERGDVPSIGKAGRPMAR